MQEIKAFDITKLPQADHDFQRGKQGPIPIAPQVSKPVPRAKVPVKDGQSQGVSSEVFSM